MGTANWMSTSIDMTQKTNTDVAQDRRLSGLLKGVANLLGHSLIRLLRQAI